MFGVSSFFDIRRKFLPLATLVTASVFVSACALKSDATTTTDPVDTDVRIASQWDSPFGRLGVVPVLPPNEDVRVGDIFVYAFNPDVQVWQDNLKRRVGIAISPRWDSLNLLEELDAEYRSRPDWPETSDAAMQAAGDLQHQGNTEPGDAQGPGLFSGDHVPRRLRSFGMPELSTFLLPEGDLNYLVPSETINLVLGSAWNDDKAVSIRINSAETYSLAMRKIMNAALEESGTGILLKEPFRSHLPLMADPASDSVWVRILSDVVYVRSIDIIIQSKAGFDEDEAVMASEFVADTEETVTVTEEQVEASEAQENETSAENGDDPEQGEIVHTETVTETVPDHLLDPAFAAFVRANAINEMLIENNADDLSGSFLRFVSVTDDSVTVRRVWQRGLAIGARGLALELDKDSGRVFRSANMGTLVP